MRDGPTRGSGEIGLKKMNEGSFWFSHSGPTQEKEQKVTRHVLLQDGRPGPWARLPSMCVQIQMQVQHSGASTQLPPRPSSPKGGVSPACEPASL